MFAALVMSWHVSRTAPAWKAKWVQGEEGTCAVVEHTQQRRSEGRARKHMDRSEPGQGKPGTSVRLPNPAHSMRSAPSAAAAAHPPECVVFRIHR